MTIHTIPAEAGGTCHCCRRTHRKLFPVDGFLLGGTCLDHYKLYLWHKDIDDPIWRGWEAQYNKVRRMLTAGAVLLGPVPQTKG